MTLNFETKECQTEVIILSFMYTGCPKINFTFLNVNNVRTNIRIATPVIYMIEETCSIFWYQTRCF